MINVYYCMYIPFRKFKHEYTWGSLQTLRSVIFLAKCFQVKTGHRISIRQTLFWESWPVPNHPQPQIDSYHQGHGFSTGLASQNAFFFAQSVISGIKGGTG